MTGNQKGIVLILTFIIMTTLTVITTSFLYMTSIQLKNKGYDVVSQKALWLADAGMQKAFYTLKNDTNFQNIPYAISGSLGSGTYSVSTVKNSSTYTFTSTGTVSNLSRQISETAVLTSSALSSAIHSDAASIDFDDSSGTVNGNIEAKNHISDYEDMTINGTITEGITQINPALDFNSYKTIAQGQGKYYTSNLTFSSGTYSGVYYTTKKVTIGNNAVINGSIFAEGYIEFANQATNITISPTNNYPAIASQGNISTKASGSPKIGLQASIINGLIYAGNNITLDYLKNNVTINGTIIADNNIDIEDGSNFTINYNAGIFTPMPPGFTYSGGSVTVIPQKDWNEITPAV